MGLKNPFRRNKARDEGTPIEVMHNPWWAWGPLGLIWFGGHHGSHPVDGGNLHHPGDAGHINHPTDPGAGMGGFDGGGGGGF